MGEALEALANALGEDDAGDVFEVLALIPLAIFGRRRAMAADWEAMPVVEKEAITKDVEALVSDLDEEQAGEITVLVNTAIGTLFQLLGRRRAMPSDWEAMLADEGAKEAMAKDLAALVPDLSKEQAGEIIPELLSIFPVLTVFGRRRAMAPEWETMFAVAEAKNAVAKDVESLVADLGKEEAGEAIGRLLCSIPAVGRTIICRGRRLATGTQWEHMKHMIATEQHEQALVKDVEQLVNLVGEEDVGEIICSIPFVRLVCLGRRRATLEASSFEANPEFAVAEAAGQDEAGEADPFLATFVATVGANLASTFLQNVFGRN